MFKRVTGFFRGDKDGNASNAEALKNRGNGFLAAGDLGQAEACYREAIAADPGYAHAYNNLGIVLKQQSRLEDARDVLEQAVQLDPKLANAHYNLGTLLRDTGAVDKTVEHLSKAIELNPEFEAAYLDLAGLHFQSGNRELSRQVILQGLTARPASADLYNNLGNIHVEERNFDAALAAYRQALSLNPDLATAHGNLGNVLQTQGHLEDAVASYRQSLSLMPHQAETLNNLGLALLAQGKPSEAIECYRQALSIKPDYDLAHSNLIFALDLAVGESAASQLAERKLWDKVHATRFMQHLPHRNDPAPERRLRIGYVSADLRAHSAAYVFGAMLTGFDRERFEVFAYSNTKIEDSLTEQFRRSVSCWRRIVDLPGDVVADMIRADGIDILVDLSGHSAGNCLLVFARKPAPIQVTAWGYATSTGMRTMDVFFADPVIVPPEEKQFFVEEVRYLPNVVGSFYPQEFPPIGELPALSAGYITFGSFNRLVKVSDETFELWVKVLQSVANSRLLLKTAELDDPATREHIAAYFMRAGISRERIALLGKSSWLDHVAAFNRIDVALDPFPHGGGVTTSESLIMGVPVITLRWPTIVGRLSASILTALELTDWIAETPIQYVDLAMRKTQDIDALAALRQQLRRRYYSSAIGDAQSYVMAVEREYRQLWREWCGRQASIGESRKATATGAVRSQGGCGCN